MPIGPDHGWLAPDCVIHVRPVQPDLCEVHYLNGSTALIGLSAGELVAKINAALAVAGEVVTTIRPAVGYRESTPAS